MNQFEIILAVKNASKKFLSPKRDKELYDKHFDLPLKKVAKLLGVALHPFGGSIKKIISTVRNLELIQKLIECKKWKDAARLVTSYSTIIGPVVGVAGDAIIKGLLAGNYIGPLVAAKLSLIVSAFSLGIYLGFALYLGFTFKDLYELKGVYDKAKKEVNDPEIVNQLNEISDCIDKLKAIENHLLGIFGLFEKLKETGKDFDLLLKTVEEKVNDANGIYENTSKKICQLNSKLNALKVSMSCSRETSLTTAIVSYGVGAASFGALLVPGLNLVVAGTLIAGSVAALGTSCVSLYYTKAYDDLIKKVAELQTEVDEKRKEMNLIKDRIDCMHDNANNMKNNHIKETKPDEYVSDSELDKFKEDGQ